MFESKYKKAMKILDEEIKLESEIFHMRCDRDYSHIKNPKVHDDMIVFNLKQMDEHLHRWQALGELRGRLQNEIGE